MTVSATKIDGGFFILPGTVKGIWKRVPSLPTDGATVRIRSVGFPGRERVVSPAVLAKPLTERRLFRPR